MKKNCPQGFGWSAVTRQNSQHSERKGEVSVLAMFSLSVEYKKKTTKQNKKTIITCDFVDFALVDYLSVHAYHHFYM